MCTVRDFRDDGLFALSSGGRWAVVRVGSSL